MKWYDKLGIALMGAFCLLLIGSLPVAMVIDSRISGYCERQGYEVLPSGSKGRFPCYCVMPDGRLHRIPKEIR